jgi:peptidyl-prolyl cis-trans isomerase SurA
MLPKIFLAALLPIFIGFSALAQLQKPKNIDKIVVIVGDHVALQSEINQVLLETAQSGQEVPDTFDCEVLDGILSKYILCEQAARDSVLIADEEVEANLDNRIRYMESSYGSAEKMEEITGKTSFQIKDDYRRFIKDLMLSQKMQGQIQQGVKITPIEVRQFFDKIPVDSLPQYPSMLEVGQIVIAPIANIEAQDYAKQQLNDIRKQIMEGKAEFETMASIYSADPGSKDLGGALGIVTRDQMVPEFSAAGFKLQNGEICEPVKTSFGYHIIQMIQRMGEKAKMRHILIKPTITASDVSAAEKKLDSIRLLIVNGKITFTEAVAKFSNDDASKGSGGMIVNPNSGSSLLTVDELGPEIALVANDLKQGEYSAVKIFDGTEGQPTSSATANENKKCRIIYLKNRNEPHRADINKDFSRIQQVALDDKRNRFMTNYVDEKIGDFYIYIDPAFTKCSKVTKWQAAKKTIQ